MAVEGARQLGPQNAKTTKVELRNIEFKRALQIPEGENDIEVQISLIEDRAKHHDNPWYLFRVSSLGIEVTEHCTGRVCLVSGNRRLDQNEATYTAADVPYLRNFSAISDQCTINVGSSTLYECMRHFGIRYGPSFQTLENIRSSIDGACVADLSAPRLSPQSEPGIIDHMSYIIHPSLLDGPSN